MAQSSANRMSMMVSVETSVSCQEPPEVEASSIIPVPDAHADIRVSESVCHHCRKYEAEQSGGIHISLFYSIGDWEWCRCFSVLLYSGHHAIMKVTYDGDELSWAAVLRHDSPRVLSTHSVESLGQIDIRRVQSLFCFRHFS